MKRIATGVPSAHRRGFPYTLYVTASPAVNAYTYGGGRLHCYLGLFASCRDDAELAGILAHEIGHNSHDHFGQQLGRALHAENILSFGGLLGRPGRAIGGLFGGTFARVVLMSHSRGQESEADDRAVDYNVAAGIDPDGLARFFARMERARGLALFQSHPSPKRRVPHIRQRIAELGGGPKDALRASPEFAVALARAKVVLPYYEELNRALAGEDIGRVDAAADKGIKDLPHHAQFHFWKGALLLRDDAEKALPHLRRAAALDRSNVAIPLTLCRAEIENIHFAEAEAAATRSIDLLPVPQAYLLRGGARIQLGRVDDARADFDALLALVPARDRGDWLEVIRQVDPEFVPN